ncbi:MAG: hypothetical protein C0517_07680, partial [Erythrobacter sp.]|nr:hypothetical protein [Erythrobacter sp.]
HLSSIIEAAKEVKSADQSAFGNPKAAPALTFPPDSPNGPPVWRCAGLSGRAAILFFKPVRIFAGRPI